MPFITVEGVEGSGKSTQLSLLAARLSAAGAAVTATREPGGTPIGGRIRAILIDPAHGRLDPMSELLLFEADRRQHLAEVVRPALAAGGFLLCDRFRDSTEAYQAAGRGLDTAWVAALDEAVREGIDPDLTLVYDCDPSEGLARARLRDAAKPGRFEGEELALHERVRAAFLAIARREPKRVVVVPVTGDPAAVAEKTWAIVSARFPLS